MKESIKILSNEAIDFYPTPEKLAEEILKDLDFTMIRTVLEPSAGKGDLLRPLAKKETKYGRIRFDVDCIELDANLRQVLKYNFSDERKRELGHIVNKYGDLRGDNLYRYNKDKREYEIISEDEAPEAYDAIKEQNYFFVDGVHTVYDDFLSFETLKTYDLILMNLIFKHYRLK